MDDAQGRPEVAITMTGDELGRIVGAAVGAALAARDRAVAEELRDLRLGQGTLTHAIGAIERHADERHQDLLHAVDELKGLAGVGEAAAGSDVDARSGAGLPLGGMEQVRDAALMRDVRGGAGHDPLPPQPFHPRRDLGGDLDGLKGEGLQDGDLGLVSLGSVANCSMNAARRFMGASPNRSMM